MARAALDSNILVYAEGEGDLRRCLKARELVDTLPGGEIAVPVQVLGETYNVLTRKFDWPAAKARASVMAWASTYDRAATTDSVMLDALILADSATLSIWDAVVLAATNEYGCTLLVTEDMQHGFNWKGVTIVNPFIEPLHPMLAGLLRK